MGLIIKINQPIFNHFKHIYYYPKSAQKWKKKINVDKNDANPIKTTNIIAKAFLNLVINPISKTYVRRI